MAVAGTIEQYQGPLDPNSVINLYGNCIIGISINEDDYMKAGSTSGNKSFRFLINGNQIWMGRTYLYQTIKPIENNVTIQFPDGAPESVLVEAVYCSAQE